MDEHSALSLECATLSAELEGVAEAMETSSRLEEFRAEGALMQNFTQRKECVDISITLPLSWIPSLFYFKRLSISSCYFHL
jgi:hypothetical protein